MHRVLGRRWLITFADLAAIMLAFFVLMFSMSEVDTHKWKSTVDALGRSFDVGLRHDDASRHQSDGSLTPVSKPSALSIAYLANLLAAEMESHAELAPVHLDTYPDRLIVRLPAEMFGQREPTQPGRDALFVLGGLLGGIRNPLEVVGYRAAVKQGDDAGFLVWSAGLTRALGAARALREAGYARPVAVLVRGANDGGAGPRSVDIIVRDVGGDPR